MVSHLIARSVYDTFATSVHLFYYSPMVRATYNEIQCKSAINRVSGMPFKWSLNPYRGCVHACHYCYARATHAYYGLNADDDFETKVFVKANLPEVLRNELAKPSWTRELVAIGTATDAYQPAEGQFRITRGALEAFLEARNPISIVTKSTLILRDIDLLAELSKFARVRVYFTLTTLDHDIWRSMEPGTPPPAKRLMAMRRLTDAGISCGVMMAPLMPRINDSVESIESVAEAARANGAVALHVSPLRLAPLVREHYLQHIATAFPELLDRYQRAYAGQNAPAAYVKGMEERANRIREAYGFTEERESLPHPRTGESETSPVLRAPRQLTIPMN
jgi:DNA repair photolyase